MRDTKTRLPVAVLRPISVRAGLLAWLFVATPALDGCDLRSADVTPHIPDVDEKDLDALRTQAESMLRTLFPDLSEAELHDISGKLDLSDVLALRSELEKARDAVAKFSADLFKTSEERVADRKKALASHNDGFPTGLAALGQICTYDAASERGEIRLSGVFDGKQSVVLEESQVTLTIDHETRPFSLRCVASGPSVDVVFLVDITGSMSNVIASVRDSIVSFVDLLEMSGVHGTVSVVTFQDSVGVNRTFQDPAPPNSFERSPFFAPVSLAEARKVESLRSFVNRLEANRGADAPENLAGAIDFARNNVIGYMANGAANVIGDGREDPAATAPFPKLQSDRQVFVALTDVTFHGDDRTEKNSSLLPPFIPRNASDILRSLHETGTTVHVSDPSWVDETTDTSESAVDADYWAIHTGGLGRDVVEGYSLVDLELVVVAERSGLLDITLDKIIGSSCAIEFGGTLEANAQVELELHVGETQLALSLDVLRL